jgi:hypothetical protein
MKYLELTGGNKPSAAVILFAGGDGVLDLQADGRIATDLELNFLIRSRELFSREGLVVAAVDTASDSRKGMNGDVRLSAQHAQDIAHVIATLRRRTEVPIWLVGSSSGTISGASVAARLADSASEPDGVVLTSPQSTLVEGLCGRTIYYASLSEIRVPVLALSHREDGCPCSPGNAAAGAKLMAALKRAPAKEHKTFAGGGPPLSKGPCLARTQHGFWGIEGQVIKAMAAWMAAHPAGRSR